MAFDAGLADRVRPLVEKAGGAEKKMFGGLAFLLRGNMGVIVHGAELIVRIDPAQTDEALRQPGVRIFDMAGRPMKGWLLVDINSLPEDDLTTWVTRGIDYASSLPGK